MNDGHITCGIGPNQFRAQFPAVFGGDRNFISLINDVVVGDDIAIFGVHDNPRAQAAGWALLLGDIKKSSEKRILHQGVLLILDHGGCRNIDYGRLHAFKHWRQAGKLFAVHSGGQCSMAGDNHQDKQDWSEDSVK